MQVRKNQVYDCAKYDCARVENAKNKYKCVKLENASTEI